MDVFAEEFSMKVRAHSVVDESSFIFLFVISRLVFKYGLLVPLPFQ